ncbi:MAG: 4-(cytidine 5'-diphospho)-2-C-methyl-D-erythritol kinase [Candidatus Baltobacteraceae bacterium]
MATLLAPAKINLTLEVLTRRSDGYHTLRSVMVPIGLYDRITLTPTVRPHFSVRSADGTPGDPGLERDNLVMRALEAAEVRAPLLVSLEKAIPVGGGLGGGSSDAAAVLRHLMHGGLGPLHQRDWLALAKGLGSDVPFFLAGTAALVEGVGERITPLGALPPWWTVVVRPKVAVPTAEAYRLLDAGRNGAPSRPRATSASLAAVDALQRADLGALQAALVNDFHDLILAAYPAVARADAALRAAGASAPLLSGSGSCLFALAESEAGAGAIAGRFDASAADAVFVCPLHHDETWR